MSSSAPVVPEVCRHCGEGDLRHQDEHPGLCCDCEDLSLGMPVEALDAERAKRNLPPLPPWVRRTLPDD